MAAAVATLAATPPGAIQAQPSATAEIGGTVKSAADDKPLARARVVVTAADGRYTFADLPAGAYTVSATRTGFAAQVYGQGRSLAGTPVTVTGGQRATGIDFSLLPGGVIAGRILDEDGSPFAGALVEALVTRTDAGAETLASVSSSQTDDHGDFRLFGLAPGNYYVSAQDPAFRSVSSPKGVLHYSPTYYPGTPFADQARTIAVADRRPADKIEFRLKLVPPSRIGGRMVAYNGRQLLGGSVIMSAPAGEGLPTLAPEGGSILPDGRFTFGQVVAGRYQIRARGQTDADSVPLFAIFSTEVLGHDIDGILMTLRPGAIVEGTVTLENRHASTPPPLSGLRVRAPFVDGNSFGDAFTGTVQPTGSFALRGVMTGAHQIVVDGLQPPWVLKHVSTHGSDITDVPIDLAEKQQVRDVRIVISDASSEVIGTVQNARNAPVANAGVLVFPRVPIFWMRTNRRMRVAYTDRDGRFAIPGLPAGEYFAVASPWIDESDFGRRERLQALENVAVAFRLDSDEAKATVALQLR
jgi:hypothetical protein